ncbi:MAG: sigma-70 family RNA polymerase sigma factor [Actinomycetota bacterium]
MTLTISGFDGVLTAAQEGSEWAWHILVGDTAPALLGFFRSRGVSNPENLAGDVFIDLGRNLNAFRGDESGFRSWVFVIAHRHMSDELRKQKRITTNLATDSTENRTKPPARARARNIDAFHLLETLTPDQQDAISLRVVAELSLDETAEVMEKSVETVQGLQRRGLSSIQKQVEHKGVPR